MHENYDIAIIGGGIIGASLAAHLANERLKVLVIDSNIYGLPASYAAAGLLTPFQLGELENTAIKGFSYKSFKYFPDFFEIISSCKSNENIDFGFMQTGSLYMIFSSSEFSKKESEFRQIKEMDPQVEFLNKADVHKQEPLVAKEIVGAYHYPAEGCINNQKFLRGMISYCIENRIQFKNSIVQKIISTEESVKEILLDSGEIIRADKYVLCNGVWSSRLLKQVLNTEENLIEAIKGEIVQLESSPAKSLNKIVFCEDGYMLPRKSSVIDDETSIILGSTSEKVDIDATNGLFQNSSGGILSLMKLFQKLVPSYPEFKIKESWSGLRPATKDRLPAMGKISGIENLYCSLGHYRNGILMGPYSGKILKDLLLSDRNDSDMETFKIDRLLKKQSPTVAGALR